MSTQVTSALYKNLWNKAVECFGTGKIFERRAKRYRQKLDFLAYLGVGVPALVGVLVIAWGRSVLEGQHLVFVASLLGVVQVVVSVVSLIRAWPAELEYSNESASANFKLAEDFKSLAITATAPPVDLESKASSLIALDQARTQQDSKKHVTEKELRWGHRHGLRQFQRECAGCKTTPKNLKPTDCGVCGDF